MIIFYKLFRDSDMEEDMDKENEAFLENSE